MSMLGAASLCGVQVQLQNEKTEELLNFLLMCFPVTFLSCCSSSLSNYGFECGGGGVC